jgi:monofunctional biosynthetic peptidoglycan transglycosylase
MRWLLRGIAALLLLSVFSVLVLRWLPVPVSAFMIERVIDRQFEPGPHPPMRYHWVSDDEIAASLRLAAVAAEDQRFPEHWGFDFEAIREAEQHNERHRRHLRGASTISQQLARNLFLWPHRDWVRKGLEAYWTLLLETLWPKHRILEVYLNVVELGDGIYGVEAASEAYFGHPAARDSWSEAALLAAVLPSPRRWHAERPSAFVSARADDIQGQMAHLGPGYLAHLP